MENPKGTVLAVDLEGLRPAARVEVAAAFTCARCASGKGCGAGIFGDKGGNRRIDALIATGITVHEGDEVRIELAPRQILGAAVIVYGLPLAGAVLAAAAAYAAGLGDVTASFAGLAGIVAGILEARRRLRMSSDLCEFTPTIVERLEQ